MGRIILVRHGETPPLDRKADFEPGIDPGISIFDQRERTEILFHFNKQNLLEAPLTDRGREQAKKTAEYLKERFQVTEIRSSTALRAVHTATIHSEILGLPFSSEHSHPEIAERINFGDDLSQTWDGFLAEWGKTNRDSAYIPQDPYIGDSTEASAAKMRQFIQSLPEREGDTVIVSHGGKIVDYANELILAGSIDNGFRVTRPDNLGRETKRLGNCSLTVVRQEGQKYTLESLGSSSHLEQMVENGLSSSQREGFWKGSKER